MVTNGVYATDGWTVDGTTTNRVAVDKPLTVRRVNDKEATIIDGLGAMRCVYLTSNATLVGFTLTNGYAWDGGGVVLRINRRFFHQLCDCGQLGP